MPRKGNNAKRAPAQAATGSSKSANVQGKSASGKGKLDPQQVGSDEDSVHDTASIISSASENRSIAEEGGETDERTQTEILEDKLKEYIDLTTQKSSQGRVNSFDALCKAFSAKYLPEFVAGRRMTLLDCAEKGLKKGRGAEQESAAKLLALLCLQLGSVADSESIYKEQKGFLLALVADQSVSPGARSQICSTLGLCTFLADCDLGEIGQVMLALGTVFSASLRADLATSPDILRLYSASLGAWSLLLTLLPPRLVYELSQTHIRRLVQLLDSTDVDLRIGAGEAIALIYEGARQFDEDFGFDASAEGDEEEDDENGIERRERDTHQSKEMDELCAKLRQLATDSHKYRAKKDRKQQRSSFRDILRAVEENEPPEIRVKFGKEALDIDSWGCKQQYDSFCHLLGSGMNLHLAQNELLREIFSLGNPLLDDGTGGVRVKKVERHHMNMAAFKARSLARGKNRDKRTAIF